MVETKDGFETHEFGKKEESDEENKEKNWKNKEGEEVGGKEEVRRDIGFFGALSDEDEEKNDEEDKEAEFDVQTVWNRGIGDKKVMMKGKKGKRG